MEHKVVISLGETTNQTSIFVDGKCIIGVIDINLHINSNQVMPTLHIITAKPTDDMPQELQNSLNEQTQILNSIPYVKLSLQEMKK